MSLSVKNLPEEMVERLRERARVNHRSLQGELVAILEAAAGLDQRPEFHVSKYGDDLIDPNSAVGIIRAHRDGGVRPSGWLSPREVYERGKADGFSSPGDSVEIIREARDSR